MKKSFLAATVTAFPDDRRLQPAGRRSPPPTSRRPTGRPPARRVPARGAHHRGPRLPSAARTCSASRHDEYIMRTGAEWFPGAGPLDRRLRRGPGSSRAHRSAAVPGTEAPRHWLPRAFVGSATDYGESIDVGEPRPTCWPRHQGRRSGYGHRPVRGRVGTSSMTCGRVAGHRDPQRPAARPSSFATYGNPVGKHAFGESFLSQKLPGRQRRTLARLPDARPGGASTTLICSSRPTTAS